MVVSALARAAGLMVSLLVAGCAAKHGVVTTYKKPETMSPIDTRIAAAECQKQALLARKRYLAAHPKAALVGFDSPVFRAQQDAADRCMRDHGMKIVARRYR